MSEPNVVEVHRLRAADIEKVRVQCGGDAVSIVSAQTTELQAGYLLGINRVLDILRKGFVIETSSPER